MFGKWFLDDKDPFKTPKVTKIPVRALGIAKVVIVRRADGK